MSTTSVQGLTALCISLVVITTVVTGLRMYSRKVQQTSLGPDDWLVLPAFACFIGMVACGLLGVHLHQFGYTAQEVAAYGLPFSVDTSLVVSLDVLSACTLGFSKISALLFYRRIFCPSGRSQAFSIFITGLVVIISLWMAAFIILPPLQCGPDLSVWSEYNAVRVKKCSSGFQIILGFVISDFILEVTVIALPIPIILKLKTSWRRRLAVVFIFLTALVSLGAAIARLVVVEQILSHTILDVPLANTKQTFIWILEAGFALIAISLPSLWYFYGKISPERVLSRFRSVISLQSFRQSNDSDGAELNSREKVKTGAVPTAGNGAMASYPLMDKDGYLSTTVNAGSQHNSGDRAADGGIYVSYKMRQNEDGV